MRKYLQIIKGTWAEYMAYRLNFILWRVRMVMQILVTYFLWWALFDRREELFGYTQATILTYVLLSNLVRTIVLGTRTIDIGNIINTGDLSNYLLRPLHFFHVAVARDAADKALNALLSLVEVGMLMLLLRPPIFIQTDITTLGLTVLTIALGITMYFFFSLTLAFFGFWTPEVWAPRFISFVIMEFFAGGLFPLDILPPPLFTLARSLPFFYFIYFPLKVYLGQLDGTNLILGLVVGVLWTGALWWMAVSTFRRGLRVYTAEGR